MGEWVFLSLLGSEDKWRAMPLHRQILCSVATHACAMSLLVCVVAAHASKPLSSDANALSVEFVLDSKNVDGTSFIVARNAATARAIPIKAAPTDVSAVSSVITDIEYVPHNATSKTVLVPVKGASVISEIQPLGTAPSPNSLKSQGKNFTKNANPVKVALSTLSGTGAKTSTSEQSAINAKSSLTTSPVTQVSFSQKNPSPVGITNKIASAVTQAAAVFLPKVSFSELDGKACQVFTEGENVQSSDPAKAKERFRSAIALMDQAIPILESESGAESAQMAEALQNVGRCYDKLAEYDRSAEYYSNCAKMLGKVSGDQSLQRGIALVFLGDAFINQRKFKEAEAALLESLPIYVRQYGESSQYVKWTYQRLNRICANTERATEAEKWRTKAEAIAAK
jgi:hypothetical protein